MKSDRKNDTYGWIVFGCLFAIFGALSTNPPLQDIMFYFFDLDTSVFVSLIFGVVGVGCIAIYFFRINSTTK